MPTYSSPDAKRFFNAMDAITAEALASPTGKILTDAGFVPHHTGGGIFVWGWNIDGQPGDEIWISNNELTDPADEPGWLLGRYNNTGFLNINEYMTVAQALALAVEYEVIAQEACRDVSLHNVAAFRLWAKGQPLRMSSSNNRDA